MRGAAWLAGATGGLVDIGLMGQGWQTLRNDPCPVIYGPHGGWSDADVVGLAIDVDERGNDTADTVVVERLVDEVYYCGLGASLVARAAEAHGTRQRWRIILRGD